MISNFSFESRGFANEPRFILILLRRFSFFMFRCATRSAPRDISTAMPVAESIFLTSAAIRQHILHAQQLLIQQLRLICRVLDILFAWLDLN